MSSYIPLPPFIVTIADAFVPQSAVETTSTTALAGGGSVQTCTPVSMQGIVVGSLLNCDTGVEAETNVLVLTTNSTVAVSNGITTNTPTSFTAIFHNPHPIGALLWSSGIGSSVVVVTGAPSPTTGQSPVVQYVLLRALSAAGPFGYAGSVTPSQFANWFNIFDRSPLYGTQVWYALQSVDTLGNISVVSPAVPWTASPGVTPGSPLPVAPPLSAGAFGPYPLLGTDVYIDPVAREAVITPYGDLLLVTGLQCLAQDLRIRVFTEPGQLLLHPTFGLGRTGLIGAGQMPSALQAQLIRARVTEAIAQDPRVQSILEVTVQQTQSDAWVIGYTVEAIGVEDPAKLNLVAPFAF